MDVQAKHFFIAGSIGLTLGGVLHMWGQFSGGAPDFGRAAVQAAMRAYTVTGMGMRHSLMDVMQCWGIYFGVLAAFAGVQNLLVIGAIGERPRVLRTLAGASALCVAVLLAVAIAYRIPPPIFVFSVVLVCFLVSLTLALGRPAAGASASSSGTVFSRRSG